MAQRANGRRGRGGALDNAWRTVEPAPAVLLYGAEEYFASRARQRLRGLYGSAHPDLEIVRMNASSYTRGDLTIQASPSLFGSTKLIEVEALGAMNDDFLTDALAYLSAPEPGIMLVMHHSGGNRGKKLIDTVRTQFTLVNCKPLKTDREKTEFIHSEFSSAKRRIAPAAVTLLAAAAADTAELASACAQLIADIPGDITEDAVNRYYSGRTEVTAFRVADAAIAGNAPEAMRLLRHSLSTGTEPIPMLGALAMRVRNISRAHGARASSTELAQQLGMAPWQAEQAIRDARRFSPAQLAHIVRVLAEADAQLKGEGQDPVYAIERAVLSIAMPGDR